jgi:Protein of unknown function (DUF3111).
MRKISFNMVSLFLASTLLLGGCSLEQSAPDEGDMVLNTEETIPETEEPTDIVLEEMGIPFTFDVDAETFILTFQVNEQTISISGGSKTYVPENYTEMDGSISWSYPKERLHVQLVLNERYLNVQITSEGDEDNSFAWPYISAEQYYLPLGEGKRVPASDPCWINYLDQEQVSVMEQLSMPFWIAQNGDYCVLFIMENPYRSQMNFSAQPELAFSVSHSYPEIDTEKTNSYRIYVTKNNPVDCAKIYRSYVKEKGRFMTLKEKAEQNPDIEKLYGAPFIYLWGENLISEENIDWNAFRQSMDTPVMNYIRSFASEIENGTEFENILSELLGQDYVTVYQKNVICNYISHVLRLKDFWNPNVFTKENTQMNTLLQSGYENLTDSQKLQLKKEALSASLPNVFTDASEWMNRSTIDLFEDMRQAGMDRVWVGLNSWEQAYEKPELVEKARENGYLIASYDSYHSIHEPGKEQWITAAFDNSDLYENATVTAQNGEKESGFQNVGRKLNPALSLPSVKLRMEKIMSNHLPFNSWFIDCDATGEIYDDYTPEHITTQEQDLAARLERMVYIRDQYCLVIGSEGGNDFAASTIAYAHGIELPSFSWIDADMKTNKESEYYIGKYYSPTGGVAEHFSKRIPVKEQYLKVFVDPSYDIPLYKLVYNDSVITAAHWDWSTFKIIGETQDRMVREVLYNVPPIYHLDSEQWEEYKADIIAHNKVWSAFCRKAVQMEMTDFSCLQGDGIVQKTVYGGQLTVVANFGDTPYLYNETEVPPHSVLMDESGQKIVYIPTLDNAHQ